MPAEQRKPKTAVTVARLRAVFLADAAPARAVQMAKTKGAVISKCCQLIIPFRHILYGQVLGQAFPLPPLGIQANRHGPGRVNTDTNRRIAA